jgi:hypothetical protein
MATHLYFARILVTPDKGHPLFWEVGSSFLELYFYADSEADAIARAKAFPAVSRWEFGKIAKLGEIPDSAPASEVTAQLIAKAKQIGISWRIGATEPGEDLEDQDGADQDEDDAEDGA